MSEPLSRNSELIAALYKHSVSPGMSMDVAVVMRHAAEALSSLPSETARSGWVAMKDRRPESLRDVLACSIYDRVSVISAHQLRCLWADAQANGEECAYSHWQEIPEAPSV